MAEVPTIDVLDKDGIPRTIATDTKLLQTLGLPTDPLDSNPASTTATQMAVDKAILQAIQQGTQAGGSAPVDQSMSVINPSTQGVAVSQDISAVANGAAGTMLTPVTIKIDLTAANSTTLVAAPGANKTIRVLSFMIDPASAVDVKFQSDHSSPVDLTGKLHLSAKGDARGGTLNPLGHFPDTAANKTLDIWCSAAVEIGGWLKYVVVG